MVFKELIFIHECMILQLQDNGFSYILTIVHKRVKVHAGISQSESNLVSGSLFKASIALYYNIVNKSNSDCFFCSRSCYIALLHACV